MTIIHRRTFYGKVGAANQLIEHLEAGNLMVRGLGVAIRPRILSDFHSGRTDRVVWEWETRDIGEVLALEEELGAYPEGEETFHDWFSKLAELIHYAEAENWQVH